MSLEDKSVLTASEGWGCGSFPRSSCVTPSRSVPTTPCAWRQYTLVFSDGDDCDRARDRIKVNHAAIAGDPFGAEEARTESFLGTEDFSEKKSSRASMYFFFFGFRRRFGGRWPSVFSMSKGKNCYWTATSLLRSNEWRISRIWCTEFVYPTAVYSSYAASILTVFLYLSVFKYLYLRRSFSL